MVDMEADALIYVAGATTLIGRALLQKLPQQGYDRVVSDASERHDVANPSEVDSFFARRRPQYVFLTAGRSGGIGANQKYPAELMRHNLLVAVHIIDAACRYGVEKLLYLASSCIYPRECAQPMHPESLFTGPLESTSAAYALSKIAGLKLCQAYRQQHGVNFISGIPADTFGPGDDFSPENSHALAALVRKLHEAKVRGATFVEVWGTGNPRREFLFAEDLADACIFVMRQYDDPQPINLGGGLDISIGELAMELREVVGYSGELRFDTSRPDGMPSKVLDWSRLREMGWRPKVPFRSALSQTYRWFLDVISKGDTIHVC